MKAVINIESPGVTIDGFGLPETMAMARKTMPCNIQAAYGIYASDGEFELDNLVLRNNVFDCFSGMGICIIDFDDYTPNENISISRNLFRNIHDLRLRSWPGDSHAGCYRQCYRKRCGKQQARDYGDSFRCNWCWPGEGQLF